MASDFGGEDRIENEESESDYQSGLKQYNVQSTFKKHYLGNILYQGGKDLYYISF